MNVGKIFRDYRHQCGLTLTELERRTGVRQPTISDIENGKHSPTVKTLMRLAKGMGAELKLHLERSPTASAAGSRLAKALGIPGSRGIDPVALRLMQLLASTGSPSQTEPGAGEPKQSTEAA